MILNRSASELYLLEMCDFLVLVQQHWSLDLQQSENTNQPPVVRQDCNTGRRKAHKTWVCEHKSPCVRSPRCGQGQQGLGRANIFSPSRDTLRWLSPPKKELLSRARGKSSSSLWFPNSSSTAWLLLGTKQWRNYGSWKCAKTEK